MEEGAAATALVADGGSGGENGVQDENRKAPEGEVKVKRKMKTAAQLEILESTYAGKFFLFPSSGFFFTSRGFKI